MLTMPARVIYVDPEVYEHQNCAARLERMLPSIDCDDVRELDDAAREKIGQIGARRHGKDHFEDDAVFVFRAYDEEREERYFHYRTGRELFARRGTHCQNALELNPIFGCPFRCAYCGFGRSVDITLDIERFVDHLPGIFEEYPNQRLYKYSNMTDLPTFEPQYDGVLPMVRRFAREENRYLMLFTKSDNVDFLLDAEHGGQTIISWSLSSATASREIDRRSATMEERIAAMRRCQKAGYLVRARLSPIVPVRNWREEYQELFKTLFAQTHPDLVTLEMLGWFDFEDLPEIISPDLLDPHAYRAAEEAAEKMRGHHKSPFPHSVRREVYEFCIREAARISPETQVSICHGTPRMWEELGPLMDMTPDDFVCNCGPLSTPPRTPVARG